MASSLHQNPTFIKPHSSPSIKPSTPTRRSYIPVHCGGPRSQRGPLIKGRFLSIEAIQAIQTLKRINRINPQTQTETQLQTKTLTRLIKSDLVATLKELLRQEQPTLALRVFSAVRSEYGADLTLYAEMLKVTATKPTIQLMTTYTVIFTYNSDRMLYMTPTIIL